MVPRNGAPDGHAPYGGAKPTCEPQPADRAAGGGPWCIAIGHPERAGVPVDAAETPRLLSSNFHSPDIKFR
ncbi:hypothetical protein ACE1SV_64530 [Streptomyces sennicomposti]